MIFKSFIRNKNTKFYTFIYTLIFIILFIVSYYIKSNMTIYNNNYKTSFIYVSKYDSHKDDRIGEKNPSINNDNLFYIIDDSLNNNEIIINSHIQSVIDNKVTICFDDCIEFIVVKNSDEITPIIHISKDMFNKYYKDGYLLRLNNWYYLNDVEKSLKKHNIEYYKYIYNSSNINIKSYIDIMRLFILVILIALFLVCLLNIRFILLDNNQKNTLYKSLGFTKLQIIYSSIIKLLFVLLLSLLFSSLIYFVITLFIK